MKMKDITTGNPVKLILAFAVPLFIGNVFQQVYSLVDAMVAGYNLGDAAIAAMKKSVAVMFALTSLGAVVLTAMTLVFIEPMMLFEHASKHFCTGKDLHCDN